MATVDDRHTSDIAEAVSELTEGPSQTETALVAQGRYSVATTIMREAWEKEGIDRDDPPSAVEQWYLPEEGYVVINLRGGDDE